MTSPRSIFPIARTGWAATREISRKIETLRSAVAESRLIVSPETIVRLRKGEIPKGDPLETAKVAAIQAAKNTARIIPYCHDIPLACIGVAFEVGDSAIITRDGAHDNGE